MGRLLVIFLIALGIFVRIVVTYNGNFIFHMDNARDMVDIREMVVLHKWRLIGPTSGIEGVFTGPLWYYIASIPFIASGGDPYASILLQIFFWAVGTYFLLMITKRWGMWVMGAVGGIWVSSNLVILNSQHSLSPNPIILLTPLFIYILEKYLSSGKALFSIASWLLVGLFFQLEMAWGAFMPIIVILGSLKIRKQKAVKDLCIGLIIFFSSLLPQIIFDLRHQFLMTNSLLSYITSGKNEGIDFASKTLGVLKLYWGIYQGLLMNQKIIIFVSLVILATLLFKRKILIKDKTIFASLLVIFIPFLGYLVLPIKAMPWHAQAGVSVVLILLGYGLGSFGKIYQISISLLIISFSIYNFQISYLGKSSNNPALLKNELAVIDYIYQQAGGKGFKAYTYMPSIVDYPYQYLFWWHGQKKYGYLPVDYAYLPNVPEYISNKNYFSASPASEKLKVFLIKEPDTRDERHLWENNFSNLTKVSTFKMGAIEIEERKEI